MKFQSEARETPTQKTVHEKEGRLAKKEKRWRARMSKQARARTQERERERERWTRMKKERME